MADIIRRHLLLQLAAWSKKEHRKPLLIKGARQVGKTSLIRQFAREHLASHIYCNFEREPRLGAIFEGSISPKKIVAGLEAYFAVKLDPADSVILFDEIQACPSAVTALKYFAEELPEQRVIGAGSLLGVSLALNSSFPVGKVETLTLYPLSFSEFLSASRDDRGLWQSIAEKEDLSALAEPLHQRLLEAYRTYLYLGGMPEVVANFAQGESHANIRELQLEINSNYVSDFAKHAPAGDLARLLAVWRAVPATIAKDNKKFVFADLEESARAVNYAAALQWLTAAGLVYQSFRIMQPSLPLVGTLDQKSFKLYPHDVGLLGAAMNVSSQLLLENFADLHHLYRGALVETFVAGQLATAGFATVPGLIHWRSNGQAEIDFIIQIGDDVFPVEVKSGHNLKSKSLSSYVNKFNPKGAIRISANNFDRSNGVVINLPVYAVEDIRRLILLP